jgi:hypothetical protein
MPPPPCRSTCEHKQPKRFGEWSKPSQTPEEINKPKTWRQLIKSPNKHRWLKAEEEEYASLIGMGTWKLVPRPAKRKIIKSKWVFKVK